MEGRDIALWALYGRRPLLRGILAFCKSPPAQFSFKKCARLYQIFFLTRGEGHEATGIYWPARWRSGLATLARAAGSRPRIGFLSIGSAEFDTPIYLRSVMAYSTSVMSRIKAWILITVTRRGT